jgi:hypothetical protein
MILQSTGGPITEKFIKIRDNVINLLIYQIVIALSVVIFAFVVSRNQEKKL